MRKVLFFPLLWVALAACGDNEENGSTQGEETTLACVPTSIEATAAAGEYTLDVTCNAGEWTAYASDHCSSWVTATVTDASPVNGQVTVAIDDNTQAEPRSGSVVLKSGRTYFTVPVVQQAAMAVSATRFNSRSAGDNFTVTVTAPNGWDVVNENDWITATKADEATLALTTAANDMLQSRTGVVSIVSGSETVEIIIYQESAEAQDMVVPEGYVLVWNDEFNEGTTLSSDWTHEVQGPGWVNNELQTYVDGQANGQRVTELVDGKLNIHCFKGSDGNIYSARVYAKVSEGWLHGYFEARIMLPSGKGTWPAFWMMPVNNDFNANPWPDCGEIDIMEEVGVDPNIVSSSIHCKAYNHTIGTQKTQSRNIGTAESEFHVYACEWTDSYLRFFVDGEELMTFNNEGTGRDVWPFTYAFYPILNLAWGGSWGGYDGVDESALPVTMKVDYVRVFQKQ